MVSFGDASCSAPVNEYKESTPKVYSLYPEGSGTSQRNTDWMKRIIHETKKLGGKLLGRISDLVAGDEATKSSLLGIEEVQAMLQRWHKLGEPKIEVRQWRAVVDLEKWLNSPPDPSGRDMEDLPKVRKFLDEADKGGQYGKEA